MKVYLLPDIPTHTTKYRSTQYATKSLARLRRNLSISQVAERATCSPLTVARIEKGTPTVSIGIYARVLYTLQLDDDLTLIAKDDILGRTLQDLSLKHRQRASKK
ncbi:MAG: helix-turn-helix domain-containing protein [Muribaculaceae bacterium]|jgi:transcriptional regulator with XRE-family HTH domain